MRRTKGKSTLLEPDWYLWDEGNGEDKENKRKPVCTFIPEVLKKVNVHTSKGVDPHVRLKLSFVKGESEEFIESLSKIEKVDWFNVDKRCLINPNYNKATQFIANIVRLGLINSDEEEDLYLLDRLGLHHIDSTVIFVAGDRVITRAPATGSMPEFELAPLPFRLDIDTDRYPARVAFDGMKELMCLSPEIGRPLLAHSISAITRSAFIAAGVTPCTTLEIIEKSGKFKSVYAATVTQLYNRADGVEPVTRLNSSDRFIEEILFEFCECTAVIDDRCTAESSKIKRKNDNTAEEIIRRIGDKTGRGRMDGKKRVQINPRGNAVFTGEYQAGTKSTVARGLMICPTTPIDGTRLDKYQRQHPLLVSTFYFYYIEWYVSHYNEIYAEIYERLTKFRETTSGIHPRLRETQFCLHIAYMLFLKFCEDSGFITTNEGQKEYISFGSQLVELVKAQNARIWADDKKSEDVDYLKLIRKLYKSNSFRLADSVEQFDRNKHDGVIHYECLCLRRESLEKRIRKIFHGARINDVINALLAQGALKLVEKKNSVQISGLPKPRPRLYCIWLDMLD